MTRRRIWQVALGIGLIALVIHACLWTKTEHEQRTEDALEAVVQTDVFSYWSGTHQYRILTKYETWEKAEADFGKISGWSLVGKPDSHRGVIAFHYGPIAADGSRHGDWITRRFQQRKPQSKTLELCDLQRTVSVYHHGITSSSSK